MTITLPFMRAANYRSGRSRQIQCLVMHSVEGPMKAGLARSLAGPNWFGAAKSKTSANAIFDQTGGVEMVRPGDTAWHVGNANSWTYGTEHCGYASFATADWLSADGQKMLIASAKWNRQLADSLGIPWRRLTQAQMSAGQRGLCTHNDCRQVWGGTTHTDPQWSDEVWSFYLAAGSSAGANPTSNPTQEDDHMSAQDVADLKAWLTPQLAAINANVDHAVKQIESDTASGNSIANVRAHQDSQGEQIQDARSDVAAVNKIAVEILKVVQS